MKPKKAVKKPVDMKKTHAEASPKKHSKVMDNVPANKSPKTKPAAKKSVKNK